MITVCAIIDLKTGKVINTVMADPESVLLQDGCALVDVAGKAVDQRWEYVDQKLEPNAELKADIEAKEAVIKAQDEAGKAELEKAQPK